MLVNIYIDTKEKKPFLDKLQENNIIFTTKSLNVGDILFSDHNNQELLIIERKTLDDLASSLNDGRYKEQKLRLKTCSCRVIYLIEGETWNKFYHKTFDEEKLKGCIINTMVRDKISVYRTKNMDDTIEFIKDIYKRLPKYMNEMNKNEEDKYEIKLKKKDNITNNICYINQLRQIPGVSQTFAEKIAENYPTMKQLFNAYNNIGEEDEKQKKQMLKNIMVTDKRKLGPVLSERIYNFLYFE